MVGLCPWTGTASGSGVPAAAGRLTVGYGPGMDKGTKTDAERSKMLSDAVFAIAMTLLVLDLKVPDLSGPDVPRQLAHALADNIGSYFAYALTFYILGLLWLGHVQIFRHIERADRPLMQLNLLLLLVIGFLPFPTALLGHYGSRTWGTVPYAVSMIVLELLLSGMWWYVRRARLQDDDADPDEARQAIVRSLMLLVVFAVSIPVAVIRPSSAPLVWILVAVVPLVARVVRRPAATE